MRPPAIPGVGLRVRVATPYVQGLFMANEWAYIEVGEVIVTGLHRPAPPVVPKAREGRG